MSYISLTTNSDCYVLFDVFYDKSQNAGTVSSTLKLENWRFWGRPEISVAEKFPSAALSQAPWFYRNLFYFCFKTLNSLLRAFRPFVFAKKGRNVFKSKYDYSNNNCSRNQITLKGHLFWKFSFKFHFLTIVNSFVKLFTITILNTVFAYLWRDNSW